MDIVCSHDMCGEDHCAPGLQTQALHLHCQTLLGLLVELESQFSSCYAHVGRCATYHAQIQKSSTEATPCALIQDLWGV